MTTQRNGRKAPSAKPVMAPPDVGSERPVEILEARPERLEATLEGLQDAIDRQMVLHDGKIDELDRRTELSDRQPLRLQPAAQTRELRNPVRHAPGQNPRATSHRSYPTANSANGPGTFPDEICQPMNCLLTIDQTNPESVPTQQGTCGSNGAILVALRQTR